MAAIEITNQIKTALFKQFPSCNFSVTDAGMGAKLVSWTDNGPAETDVENAIVGAGLAEIRAFNDVRCLCLRLPNDSRVQLYRYSEAELAADQQDSERQRLLWQAAQQTRLQRRQEQAARVVEAARVAQLLWAAQDIPAVPLLEQLNIWVIKQNEKRLPKWKFRLAGDFAVQIHPRLTRVHELLFECVALQADNLSVKLFLDRKLLRGERYWRMGFKLSANVSNAATWSFKPTSVNIRRDCPRSGPVDFRQRVVAALHPDHFVELRPDLMLSPNCMCCGKGLTDPVSMSRWIGPECWGSASINLPRIFKTNEALRSNAPGDGQ
jgi:hypothetical protein